MKIISSIDEMQEYCAKLRSSAKNAKFSIGFVPTMGYLHEGHLSLMKEAAARDSKVIASIFVNPTQFAPNEDLSAYPRDSERDIKMMKDLKCVDCVFMPDAKDMYPEGFATYVANESSLTKVLCGLSRPSHFKGVTTVVSKLLNIVNPHALYLGQKDYQQAVIIKRMVKDLNFGCRVEICPIIREKDGLAMSSRNKYLTPDERAAAPVIYRALQMAESMIEIGERDPQAVIREIRRKIKEEKAEPDYVEVVNTETLEPVTSISGEVLVAVAAFFGKTRLIDNTISGTKG